MTVRCGDHDERQNVLGQHHDQTKCVPLDFAHKGPAAFIRGRSVNVEQTERNVVAFDVDVEDQQIGHRRSHAHRPNDGNQHFCPPLRVAAFQRPNNTAVSVQRDHHQSDDAGVYAQILHERTQFAEKRRQIPFLEQRRLELKRYAEDGDEDVCEGQVTDIQIDDGPHSSAGV